MWMRAIAAAASDMPQPFVDQLADGGRIIIPLGESTQQLVRFTRHGDRLEAEGLGGFNFVPLIG